MQYLYSNIAYVCEQMSDCARRNIPFLFAFNFELNEAIFIPNPLQQKAVLFRTPLGGNAANAISPAERTSLIADVEPLETYAKKFETVTRALLRGDSFLTNLTTKTPIRTNRTLHEVFCTADAAYCLYVPQRFVCFSPERFVHITPEGHISTHPMKGTISTSVPNAEQVILSDEKESAEHATVVDLLRNDLSINAEKVRVSRYRYITRIETEPAALLQVSSEIGGELHKGWQERLGKIVLDMLPAGSIAGAPKKATVDTIQAAEGEERGFYTGVFGYYDGATMDSAVIIRYIEEDANGNQFFRSGGGITAKSKLNDEYNEIMQKIYIPEKNPKFSDVICVRDGVFERLDYHLRRMNNTCQTFYGKDLNVGNLTQQLPLSANTGLFKCRIVYGSNIEEVTFTAYHPKEVKKVAVIEANDILYNHKYLDRSPLSNLVAACGTDDVIIVKNGVLTDSSFCNLVLEDPDGQLFTPKEALLKGTYRQWLLDQQLVKEITIPANDLRRYKYVYFVNAMRGLADCTKLSTDVIS